MAIEDGYMKNLFKPEAIKTLIRLLLFLLVIKLFWFIIQVTLLTAEDIDQEKDQSSKALYYRVKLTPNNIIAPQKLSRPTIVKKVIGRIKEITLLAIYNASDISVVTIIYKHKSKVLSTGDTINGFTLEGAGNNFAMFSQNNKNYKILLDKKSQSSSSIRPSKKIINSSKVTPKLKKVLGEITNEGSAKIIDRSLLEHYANNMDDIYKNISISEIKEGRDIKGFKVNSIRKGSPFEKLGMLRGDIIKAVNGQKINSYNAAFAVYKNIKNIDNLSLVIIRGKEEMELEYEIN